MSDAIRAPKQEVRAGGRPQDEQAVSGEDGKQSGLLRFYWMAVGNLLLLAVAGFISKQPTWNVSHLDVAYIVIVGSLVAARALDIWKFAGETSNGDPATPGHFARYSAGLVAVAGALWAFVHSMEV